MIAKKRECAFRADTGDATSRPKREPVLVILNSDGFVEVFANKNVDALIVNKIHASTPEGEITVEEFTDSKLPRRFKDVHWPALRRATENWRKFTMVDHFDAEHKIACFAALENLARRADK